MASFKSSFPANRLRPWTSIPAHLLSHHSPVHTTLRAFSSSSFHRKPEDVNPQSSDASAHEASGHTTAPPAPHQHQPRDNRTNTTLTHTTPAGQAHMVSISAKLPTKRTAIAVATLRFSNPTPAPLIRRNEIKKGDVLATARIAGIMASKRCAELVPLCHPIALTKVGVACRVVDPGVAGRNGEAGDVGEGEQREGTRKRHNGAVEIEARVETVGPTGVEMEALTAAHVAALTVYDMCKAVDKHMVIGSSRVVLKTGGKSGSWVDRAWVLKAAGVREEEARRRRGWGAEGWSEERKREVRERVVGVLRRKDVGAEEVEGLVGWLGGGAEGKGEEGDGR